MRAIAAQLDRSPSTISRELARNSQAAWGRPQGYRRYRASVAQRNTERRARRPKTAKLAANPGLRQRVQADLIARWSPEQISARLTAEFPDQPEMWVSHETIYQSLYVQGRGALRRELAVCLRTGRGCQMVCVQDQR
jgi:IS30 family transposase